MLLFEIASAVPRNDNKGAPRNESHIPVEQYETLSYYLWSQKSVGYLEGGTELWQNLSPAAADLSGLIW